MDPGSGDLILWLSSNWIRLDRLLYWILSSSSLYLLLSINIPRQILCLWKPIWQWTFVLLIHSRRGRSQLRFKLNHLLRNDSEVKALKKKSCICPVFGISMILSSWLHSCLTDGSRCLTLSLGTWTPRWAATLLLSWATTPTLIWPPQKVRASVQCWAPPPAKTTDNRASTWPPPGGWALTSLLPLVT